jgi:phosphatidylglycerophosphate synthase
MIDGMVAVEGGLKTKTGDLFNEVPDRISDTIIFVGAAYSSAFPHLLELGWGAAVLAILTAYVRAMGVTLGVGQMFHGPMAKPHRMATLTIACLLSTTVSFLPQMAYIIPTALIVICVGSIVTTVRRLNAITNKLHQ